MKCLSSINATVARMEDLDMSGVAFRTYYNKEQKTPCFCFLSYQDKRQAIKVLYKEAV